MGLISNYQYNDIENRVKKKCIIQHYVTFPTFKYSRAFPSGLSPGFNLILKNRSEASYSKCFIRRALEWSVLQGSESEPPSAGHAAADASSRGGASARGPAADRALGAAEARPAGPSTGHVWGLCQAEPEENQSKS